MKSLRLRLALISAAISGIVLVGFGLAGWILTARILHESIDLRLSVPLDRIVRDLHPRGNHSGVIENVEFGMGDEISEGKRMILMLDRDGETIYQAPDSSWVENIPKSYLDTRIPRDQRPPDPGPGDLRLNPPAGPAGGGMDGPKGKGKGPPRFDRDTELELAELLGVELPEGQRRPLPLREKGKGPPQIQRFTFNLDGDQWRAGVIEDRGYIVLMATNLREFESDIARIRRMFFVALPLCLLVIGLGGWFVADRAMRPVDVITETAGRISASGLDQRIPVNAHNYRELAELVEVLNNMIDRLERSFRHATRFSADVSHELKTPLAVMQASLQSALKDSDPDSPEQEHLITVNREAERLKRIIRSLMLLAQADAGQLAIRPTEFSLSEEVAALCEDAEILCEKKKLNFEAEIQPDLTLKSDPVLLRQAFQNLVSNAVKYNQRDGTVSCRLYRRCEPDEVVFSIANTGPGIPEDEREKIFERFYRVDPSRSREIDGFGLGLNLAWEIVRAVGGTLSLAESSASVTRFEVSIRTEEH